jgi:hypothetical protein
MLELNLLGRRFGKLVVTEKCGTINGNRVWRCNCDCGNIKEMKSRSLVHDNIRSCGCLLKWKSKGYVKKKYYHTWMGIIYRCYKTTDAGYKRYGAKGIKMCDEWKNDYWIFHNWMEANGWKPGLQVDRFPDKNGNYCPENCRLATQRMQNNNRNDNVAIEYRGEIKNVSEWAHEYGIDATIVFSRLRDKWDFEKALVTPIGAELGYLKRIRNSKGQFK